MLQRKPNFSQKERLKKLKGSIGSKTPYRLHCIWSLLNETLKVPLLININERKFHPYDLYITQLINIQKPTILKKKLFVKK